MKRPDIDDAQGVVVSMRYDLHVNGNESAFMMEGIRPAWDIAKQRWVIRHDGFVAEGESLHVAIPLWLAARDGWPIQSDVGRSYYEGAKAPEPVAPAPESVQSAAESVPTAARVLRAALGSESVCHILAGDGVMHCGALEADDDGSFWARSLNDAVKTGNPCPECAKVANVCASPCPPDTPAAPTRHRDSDDE